MAEPKQVKWVAPMVEYLRRLDGNVKGPGFAGTVKNSEGYDMTELSVGLPGTEEGFYPLLGPWLTDEQMATLQSGGEATPDMYKRAQLAASQRETRGQPNFAPPGHSAGPVTNAPTPAEPETIGQTSPFDDVLNWLNMTPASPKVLNPQEQDDLSSRLLPYQPRVPVDAELAAEQADREEAQRQEQEWLEWRSQNYDQLGTGLKVEGGANPLFESPAAQQGLASDDQMQTAATLAGWANQQNPNR